MKPRIPVGIDLGTTFSAAARINKAGKTEMVEAVHDGLLTPSVVRFADSEVHVGGSATGDDRTVANAKRLLGTEGAACPVGDKTMPPEVVLGFILRHFKENLTSRLGDALSCVITVPAYFDEPRRRAVADAGKLSGLDVLGIVNEPTAAALAYGEKLGYLDQSGQPNKLLKVLVYDLGGGTLDVTAINLSQQEIVTVATDGDVELGGLNWDEALAELLWEKRQAKVTDGQSPEYDLTYWRGLANQVKHHLSKTEHAKVRFKDAGGEGQLTVTREEFEDATLHLVERTLFTARQCLGAAEWTWKDVDRLLLVGGSTRMPMIRAALKIASQRKPEHSVHPDEAVARGAAIFAQTHLTTKGLASVARELSVTDVCAHTLGVVGVDVETQRREVVGLIPKNSTLPCTVKRSFVTRVDNQPSVGVEITEGESTLPEHNSKIGRAEIVNLPPGLPAGTKVEVTYHYDASGHLQVDAKVPGVGTPAKLDMHRVKSLPDERLSKWKEVVSSSGGYGDMGDAILSLMDDPVEDDQPTRTLSPPKEYRPKQDLAPAVDEGASLAASKKLKHQAKQRPKPKTKPKSAAKSAALAAVEKDVVQVRDKKPAPPLDPAERQQKVLAIAAGVTTLVLLYVVLCLLWPGLRPW